MGDSEKREGKITSWAGDERHTGCGNISALIDQMHSEDSAHIKAPSASRMVPARLRTTARHRDPARHRDSGLAPACTVVALFLVRLPVVEAVSFLGVELPTGVLTIMGVLVFLFLVPCINKIVHIIRKFAAFCSHAPCFSRSFPPSSSASLAYFLHPNFLCCLAERGQGDAD